MMVAAVGERQGPLNTVAAKACQKFKLERVLVRFPLVRHREGKAFDSGFLETPFGYDTLFPTGWRRKENGSIWGNTRRGSDADVHYQSLGFSPRSSYPVPEMTEEEAVFVLGKQLSELRQAGKPMGITRVWVDSSFVSPAELADEYEKHFPPVPKIDPPSEAEIRHARYRALPEDERLAPLPVSETDDSPYARACRSFDALIAAMLAANNGYVADAIAFHRFEFMAPGASPRDQLNAITGVSGGFFSKGEWDRVAEHGGMPYPKIMESLLRLYEYLETLPFGEADLVFIKRHISSLRR